MSAIETLRNTKSNKLQRRAMLAVMALAVAVPLAACASGPQESVSGTISTRQSVALTSDSVLVVRLLDATRGDMAAYTVAEQRTIASPLPARFDVRYRFGDINPSGTYYLQAQVEQGGRVVMINDQNYSVITRNSPSHNVLVNLVPTAGVVMVPATTVPTAVVPASPAATTTTTTTVQTSSAPAYPAGAVIVPGGVVTPR